MSEEKTISEREALLELFSYDDLKGINVDVSYAKIKEDFINYGGSSYLRDTLLTPDFFASATPESYANEIIVELDDENYEQLALAIAENKDFTQQQIDFFKSLFDSYGQLEIFIESLDSCEQQDTEIDR